MTPTLDQIKDRAQRHLDGMKVSTDAMARDVIKLCDAIAAAAAHLHAQARVLHTLDPDHTATVAWVACEPRPAALEARG